MHHLTDQYKDSGTDDRPNSQAHQTDWPKHAIERVSTVIVGFCLKRLERLSGQNALTPAWHRELTPL